MEMKQWIIRKIKKRTAYIGNSRDKFEKYCRILKQNDITYKKTIINQSSRFPFGHGDLRSFGSNYGIIDSNIYEITVSELDYEKVKSILSKIQ